MHEPENDRENRLTRFSLDRRITVLVLLATALVVGGVTASMIPVELIPRGFSEPFLSIFVPWRDAPPREVLEKINEPLEEELSSVRGVDRITSVSQTGRARTFLRFKQGTDMDLAYREVRDRIERARRDFPEDVDRVYTFKDDVSGVPVYVMGAAVDTSVADYYSLLQQQIVLPIERIDGVASVEVNGLEEKEILIEIDRDRAAASGLNIYELAQELGEDSFTMASGHVRDAGRKLLLRSVARYRDLDELEHRLVGNNVRLKDVATISYQEADKRYRVRAMSKPAYAIIVFKEGEANTRAVSARIAEEMERMQKDPRLAGVEIIDLFNQGDMINESLSTLLKSGAVGALLAAFVLFFFLRRFRMMLVVNLAVPLSLLIAIAVMFFAGETLNIISLLSLMVCIGLLVDNSVVVAENIDRMHKEGRPRREAAIRGAGEIALAILMSTLTTVIVFLPVSLVEGPGQFFLLRMAIPICVALLASLGVALVCIPLGVYLTLPNGAARPRGASYTSLSATLARAYEASFGRVNRAYGRLLAACLRRRLDMVLAVLAIFAVTAAVTAKRIKFVETQQNEEAGFEIDVEMPEDYSFEETEQWFLKAEKVVEEHREELGLEGWFEFHRKTQGEIQGWFTNPRSTKLSTREVTERVVELLPKAPGVKLTTGDDSRGDDEEGEGVYRLTLNGEDPARLDDVARELERVLVQVPGVLGIRKDSELTPNELGLVVDRERTRRYGVNPMVVAGVVGYALRGQSLPKHYADGKEIPVRVRFKEEDRESIADLASFPVPIDDGTVLPLSAVTDVKMLTSPETIVRRNKRIARTLALDLKEGEEEEARERLSALAAGVDLPEGVTFASQSVRRKLNEDLAGLFFALGLSVIFIYLLMGLLFESFILPMSIILTIPLASLGVLWIHILSGLNIDFLGAVGIVLLVGVVVNNGIVLIDYVNRLRGEGLDRTGALLLSAERRFRPIMMTAITTIGGMIPLAISGRMDSGLSYTSFALTLIGGMTTATILTLLVIPVFYTFFDDMRLAFGAAFKKVVLGGTRPGAVPDGAADSRT